MVVRKFKRLRNGLLTVEIVVRKLKRLRNGLVRSLGDKKRKINIREYGMVRIPYILCNFSQ